MDSILWLAQGGFSSWWLLDGANRQSNRGCGDAEYSSIKNPSKRKPYKWELDSMPNPMIVNYADDILFRGCYRGQKSCHGPLDSLMRVLKKTILKMDARFRYNRGLPRCGFKVKGGWNGLFYFGDENVRSVFKWFRVASELEQIGVSIHPFKVAKRLLKFDSLKSFKRLLDFQPEVGQKFS